MITYTLISLNRLLTPHALAPIEDAVIGGEGVCSTGAGMALGRLERGFHAGSMASPSQRRLGQDMAWDRALVGSACVSRRRCQCGRGKASPHPHP
jgi:hypothetical protein